MLVETVQAGVSEVAANMLNGPDPKNSSWHSHGRSRNAGEFRVLTRGWRARILPIRPSVKQPTDCADVRAAAHKARERSQDERFLESPDHPGSGFGPTRADFVSVEGCYVDFGLLRWNVIGAGRTAQSPQQLSLSPMRSKVCLADSLNKRRYFGLRDLVRNLQ